MLSTANQVNVSNCIIKLGAKVELIDEGHFWQGEVVGIFVACGVAVYLVECKTRTKTFRPEVKVHCLVIV